MPLTTAAKKVKPALFRFDGSKKHWVLLSELAEIIGWEPEKILEIFSDLVKPEYDGNGAWRLGDLHWRRTNGETCCHSDPRWIPPFCYTHPAPQQLEGPILVPVDFSKDVILVRKWGVIRLKRVAHASLDPLEGSLRDFDYTRYATKNGPKGVWRMAIVGLTHPTDDAVCVKAPFGRHYPLLG